LSLERGARLDNASGRASPHAGGLRRVQRDILRDRVKAGIAQARKDAAHTADQQKSPGKTQEIRDLAVKA